MSQFTKWRAGCEPFTLLGWVKSIHFFTINFERDTDRAIPCNIVLFSPIGLGYDGVELSNYYSKPIKGSNGPQQSTNWTEILETTLHCTGRQYSCWTLFPVRQAPYTASPLTKQQCSTVRHLSVEWRPNEHSVWLLSLLSEWLQAASASTEPDNDRTGGKESIDGTA